MKNKVVNIIVCLLTMLGCTNESLNELENAKEFIDVSFSDGIITQEKIEEYLIAKERFYQYVQKDSNGFYVITLQKGADINVSDELFITLKQGIEIKNLRNARDRMVSRGELPPRPNMYERYVIGEFCGMLDELWIKYKRFANIPFKLFEDFWYWLGDNSEVLIEMFYISLDWLAYYFALPIMGPLPIEFQPEIPIADGTLIVTTALPMGVYPIPNRPTYYVSGGYTKGQVKKCFDRTEFTWRKGEPIFFDDVIY